MTVTHVRPVFLLMAALLLAACSSAPTTPSGQAAATPAVTSVPSAPRGAASPAPASTVAATKLAPHLDAGSPVSRERSVFFEFDQYALDAGDKNAAREALRTSGLTTSALAGIGIGCTGPVDPRTGVVNNPYTLPGWEGGNLIEALSAELDDLPVWLENDADTAAVGEYHFGAGQRVAVARQDDAGDHVNDGVGGFQPLREVVAGDLQHLARLGGDDGGNARSVVHDGHFADDGALTAGADRIGLAIVAFDENLDFAFLDDVGAVTRFALAHDDFAGLEGFL